MSHLAQLKKKCCCDGPQVCYLLTPCVCVCCTGGDCCYSADSIVTGDFRVPVVSGLSNVVNSSFDWLAGYVLQGGLMGVLYEDVELERILCGGDDATYTTWWAVLDSYSWFFADFFGSPASGTWYLHLFVRKLDGKEWVVWMGLGSTTHHSSSALAHTSDAVVGLCCSADGDIDIHNAQMFDSHDVNGTFDFVVSNNHCFGTNGGTPPCVRSTVDTCDGDDGLTTVPPTVKVTNDLSAYTNDEISLDDGGGRLAYTVSTAEDCDGAITLDAGTISSIVEHVSCIAACDYIHSMDPDV